MLNKLSLALITTAVISLTACANNTSKEPESVKARQNLMQDWRAAGEHMKGMMDNPDSFDAATFGERADLIANSTDQMWAHFEGEANKGGKSKDDIWANSTEWAAQEAQFSEAAQALATAAKTASTPTEIGAQFGKMMESCGSCHKAFRN